jgi:echinoderm microtubule-associated protein-like 6
MRSHYNRTLQKPSEISSIAAHSTDDNIFFTCGDDGTLRVWNAALRQSISGVDLNIDKTGNIMSRDPNTREIRSASKLQSLSYCSKYDIMAIGCEDGTVRVVSLKEASQLIMFRHRRSTIQVSQFSPDSSYLAVGSEEGYIDLYSVPNFKRIHQVRKNISPITHLDWSIDSKFIQFNNKEEELHYIDCRNGQILSNGGAVLKDMLWNNWKCKYGWPVQGVYDPSNMDSKNIAAVHRSPPPKDKPNGSKYLAVGMLDAVVRIFRYPCISNIAEYIELQGHAGVVSDLTFSPNNRYLYTVGSDDLTILQWRIIS